MAQPKTKKILGQPSWEISSDTVQLAVTRMGGHMAPVRFKLGARVIEPYSVAPWAEEKMEPGTPNTLRALRGDFFCAPFGGNDTPFRGMKHPPHGDSAGEHWNCESLERNGTRTTLHLAMKTKILPGRADKFIQLRDKESVIYCRHSLSGMTGPMTYGHHATLKFPAHEGSGRISTSPISFAQVAPIPFELPELRGYQCLKPGAIFERLDQVPSALGGYADLSRYPARRGYEDIVMLVHSSREDFAWSAVAFPEERYVWFSLKDPRVLQETVFWISNGGRHYPPWNGRHVNVMGMEDVTSYFHYGLAESARANPLSRRGYSTSVQLNAKTPLTVSYIMGTASLPKGFTKVKSIVPSAGHVVITSTEGKSIRVPVDTSFLQNTPL